MTRIAEFKGRLLKAGKAPSLILAFSLAVITAAVFIPVARCDFLNYDDNYYITQNPYIRQGLTLEGLKWAFSAGLSARTSAYADYWQPVTAISRMLDMQLYGLNPAGHHLTSLIIHILNVLLLFYVLKRATGSVYRSAFAAMAFGIHPIQVEAVTWLMGRKDVLGMFFSLLTLGAYIRYVGKPCFKRNLLVSFLFLLTVMSKPIPVILPFLFLLLDFWPLQRMGGAGGRERWRVWGRLVCEKIPLFVLSVFSIATLWGKNPSLFLSTPLPLRFINSVVFYAAYLGKWLVPKNLSLWYPYPGEDLSAPPFLFWQVAAAGLTVIAISVMIGILSRRRPFLLTGWLWYVVALLSVFSLKMQDRYLYLPSIGLAILTAWGIGEICDRLRIGKKIRVVSTVFVLLIWATLSFNQAGYWKNPEILYKHCLTVIRNSFNTNLLGNTIFLQQRYAESVPFYEEAIRLKPDWYLPHDNLGSALERLNRFAEAEKNFREAIRLAPLKVSAYKKLFVLLKKEGKLKEAEECMAQARETVFPVLQRGLPWEPQLNETISDLGVLLAESGFGEKAMLFFEDFIKINPYLNKAYIDYGEFLEKLGRFDEALALYLKAVQSIPDFEIGHLKAGILLARRGLYRDAAAHYEKALRIDPDNLPVLSALTAALVGDKNYDEAVKYYREIIRLNPADPKAHYNLGYVLQSQGLCGEAVEHYRIAVSLDPDYRRAYFNLGSCYAKLGRFEDAAAAYEKALVLDPANAPVHYNLGLALEKLGRTEEARGHYAGALRIEPGYEEALKRLEALDQAVPIPKKD